jgi:hypothetical protein
MSTERGSVENRARQTLAQRLGAKATPVAVADAFAEQYPADFRPGFRAGCLEAMSPSGA